MNENYQRLTRHSEFFFYSDEFWKGPGSPVIFFTPGEIAAANYFTYLTNARVTGVIAKEIGAAIVVMEHRYWGKSSPYEDLTTTNLQYLTLENSIEDTQYFARNAYLPFDPTNSSNADSVVSLNPLQIFQKSLLTTVSAMGICRWFLQWRSCCVD